jgi:hypothetical protein
MEGLAVLCSIGGYYVISQAETNLEETGKATCLQVCSGFRARRGNAMLAMELSEPNRALR